LTAIPDVSGVSVSEATSALAEAELVVSATSLNEFDLVLPEGIVKGTSPGAGEAVDKGTEVKLIVSLGPNPVSVPSLAGETLASTQALLQELNLILGISREEFSNLSSKGTLLRLTDTAGVTLSPGTEILAGSTVDAVFSAGTLPEVSGLTVDEARNFLDQVGLTGVVGGDGAFSDSNSRKAPSSRFWAPQRELLLPVTPSLSSSPEAPNSSQCPTSWATPLLGQSKL